MRRQKKSEPLVSADELSMMVLIVASLDPAAYDKRPDAERSMAAIYKAKSLTTLTDGVRTLHPFSIVGS